MDRSAAEGVWRLRIAQGANARHALIAGLLTALAMLALALAWAASQQGTAQQSRQQLKQSLTLRGQRLALPSSAHMRAAQAAASLPLALQAQLATARAATEPAFRVERSGQGFVSANAGQGLSARYDANGVALAAAGLTERFSANSLSAGTTTPTTATTTLGEATLSAHANHVTLERGRLSEWYSNSALGIEQGFTVDGPPSAEAATSNAAASSELSLGIALSGNAEPKLSSDGATLTLEHGSTEISYGALRATDATGRALHSSLSLQGSTLTLHVATAGARYPLSIDPLIQKGSKLTGAEEGARFGTSMALSADGSTLIVGAPQANGSTGAAYVFTRAGESWSPQAVITPPASATSPQEEEQCAEESLEEVGECSFGASVAISADGKTALIGDPSPSTTAGTALIYVRSEAGAWTQQAMLAGDGVAGHEGRFGKSVALSADG
ncbi:MAG TPA: integrin alpha, partial [Solirubrobacteraceae bacterium]